MPRKEHVLTIFVASPSDVSAERSRLEEVITELNQSWSKSLALRLDLVRWETHAYPGFGADSQDVINSQIPTDFDVFIGIMWHRFGTPTNRAESGTEEEFLRAKAEWERNKQSVSLMVYFKDGPVSPSQIDAEQLVKVVKFKSTLGSEGGLYWKFQSTDDFANLVRVHLTRVVQGWREKFASEGVSQEKVVARISDDSLSIQNDMESGEPGLLELNEEVESTFQEAFEGLTRIATATEFIAKKLCEHTKRFDVAAQSGAIRPTKVKRLVAMAANDMNKYAAKLGQEIPALQVLLESGIGSLSKALSMWPEFNRDDLGRDQMKEAVGSIQTLRDVLLKAETQVQGFLNSVIGLPRLTTDLNQAKRSVAVQLQSLIGLLQSQRQLLIQTEMVVMGLIEDDPI